MMDRSREGRRVNMAASNGLSRRRHRSGGGGGGSSSSLRDSPEDDGQVEVNEAGVGRLRDRAVVGKKDRDRERDRERDRIKRRRGERLIVHHAGAGHNFADDSDDDSLDDEEEDDGGGGGSVRLPPHNSTQNHFTPSSAALFPNHHSHGFNHRKSFPQPPQPFHPPASLSTAASGPSKMFRSSPAPTMAASPATAPPWASDEVIGVSVPRKARSASTKRPQESWASSGGGGSLVGSDHIHRQTSTSPARSSGPGASGLVASASAASAAPAPVSPSLSNASAKKKLKTNGQKQRPPKSSSGKSASSAQDEIEIEIAEVLYGMMRQPQVPASASKPETSQVGGSDSLRLDLREASNGKPASDSKSRVSSPVSNSPSASGAPAQSNSISASGAPLMSATAPKRKRPRPVKYEAENPTGFPVRSSPVPILTAKVDSEQSVKAETCSPKLEKTLEYGMATQDNGGKPSSSEPFLEPVENCPVPDSDITLTKEPEAREMVMGLKKEGLRPPNPALKLDLDREVPKASKSSPAVSEAKTQRGEKFEIDLMAPPPVRSSPERDSEIDFVAVGPKPTVTNVQTDLKKPQVVNKDEDKVGGKEDVVLERDEKRVKVTGGEVESQKPSLLKERSIDLRLDLEKNERGSGSISGNGTKSQQNVQKQQQQQPPSSEKSAVGAQTTSLHLPMSMAGWPGALPHMGYMAPLQGVVSMEGNALPSAAMPPPHLLSSPQRLKRCATHCYIARNIHYHQQLSRMNPFWPAAAGSGLAPYGAKMNVLPTADLHTGRGVNPLQDKGQGTAALPGPPGKDKSSPAANVVDAAQRKQILVQQPPLPPGGPNNMLHGPAFIFPLSQQQAVAAASVRPGNGKTQPAAGGASSSSSSTSSTVAAAATAVAGATAMNFAYPNMAGSETPYLAILQNGAYPIPIPAHMGTNPAYRGAHPQAMPFFNGSFYPTQMLHPSQLQQQQQPPPSLPQQSQRGPQNPIVSSGSSSSQKQLLNQQQKSHGNGPNLQGYSATKNQSSQSLQFQQRQQPPNPNVPHQVRQHEGETGSEDSPSPAAASRANTSIYGQNFMVPIHPPNFAFMNPAAMAGASGVSGNSSDKKQQHGQQQSSRAGVDSLPSQSFAMSFASMNGAAAAQGFDISSIAQNSALLQSLPEAARHSIHFMAAANAQAQHHKLSYRATDEGKTGGNDSSNTEEDRKAMVGGKVPANAGQSIAFARPDLTNASVSSMAGAGNHVIDSSARNLNLGSAPGRLSGSVVQQTVSNVNAPGVQQQLQRAQQQQMFQRAQQHQQFTVSTSASARSKNPATINGNAYPDHASSSPSSVAAKFPSALSGFPQSIVQNSGSPVQSPQWKNSVRTTISQVPSPSSLASNSSALKNLPQQQNRAHQSHTQISFGASTKPTGAPQGQSNPSSNQSPSSPMVVGSPTTSMSKSAGGSPRTTSTSTSNKVGQDPTPSQQVKNSGPIPAQKSSPVGGRNAPSILGHPNSGASTPSSAPKPHQLTQQQQQQQQLSKFAHSQSQMMYAAGAYMQSQAPHVAGSTNNPSPASGFYLQRHRNEQQQPLPQSQGPLATSSTGMLTLCPPVSTTTDPAKAAAASNMKGGASAYVQFVAAQSSGKPHQLVNQGFPYVHAVPAAVQVKQSDQKQPAGD